VLRRACGDGANLLGVCHQLIPFSRAEHPAASAIKLANVSRDIAATMILST
jgi:hypothetical protein